MECKRLASVARRTLSLSGFVLLCALGDPAAARAQSRSIRFDRLSLEQGLSQVTVNCILQDRVGFLWVGTQDGLNRYDGHDFRVYKQDPTDPASLASDWITALAEDVSGDFWVGTDGGGLSRWQRASDSFTHLRHDPQDPASLPSDRVRTLLFDRKGTLWVGTFQSGLARRDPVTGAFESFRHDPADTGTLSDDRVRSVYEDRAGNLWVGTLAGLDRFDRATGYFVHFRHDPSEPASLSDNRVTSILEDHLGTLWVGTEEGLNRRDPAAPGFVRYLSDPADSASLSHDLVWALLEDRDQRLWIGTDGGISLLQDRAGSFYRYHHDAADPNSLSNDRVLAIFQDRGGVLWLGTQGGGLSKWNPVTWSFSHYRADPASATGLSSNEVFAFSEDPEGRLWIGTFGAGLNVFERAPVPSQAGPPQAGCTAGCFTHYRYDPEDPASLSDDRVAALVHDHDGVLWVGTAEGGLSRFASGKFRHYRHDPAEPGSLSDDNVTSLFVDREGTLWVGTFRGGLNRLDRGAETFVHFRHDPADPRSLSDDLVTSFAEDGGWLWVGTFGGGLNRRHRATADFQRFQHDPNSPSSLSSDTVHALHVDGAGTLWVGTRVGLNKLESIDESTGEANFRHYFERHGLPNDTIYSIYSDTRGTLWMSTNNGLSRFDPRHETFKNYDRSHGLQGKEFNFGAHFQNRQGELFFGGTNGFNAFSPERIESNMSVPPVVLTAFTKLGQPVPLGKPVFDLTEISLDYRDDIVSFEFAALDYTAPEKNRYRYKLEGFHDDWIDNGYRRRLSFTNLDPGGYVLKVQGSNNDGVWSEEGLSVAIRIAPPFWQTVWFRAASVLATLSAVWVGHLVRVRNIRKHNEELQILVRERTRELEEAQERLVRQERLAVLGELAGSVAHEIRNPLGIIKNSSFFLRITQKLADDKAKEHLALIDREIHRTNLIITELLDYARDRSPELRRFPLQEIADKALADVTVPESIRVERRFEEEPVVVEADPGQIERLLANLIRNAIQAMPDGGTLSVACQLNDGQATTTVADTGVGIAADHLTKIFEPLFTTKAKGIGLGLALSQRYAQLNRGRLECESTEGEGATFRLVLRAPEDPSSSRS